MIFYMIFLVGITILRQNPNKITDLYGCGFKKLGLGQTPAPLVGTKSQLSPKICFEGSPYPSDQMSQRSQVFWIAL